jgi:hypothetical protein
LLAFPPVFLLFLGALQLALLCAADLVVRHAAIVAARSAIVVLDDDKSYYGDEPRDSISESSDFSASVADLSDGLGPYFGQSRLTAVGATTSPNAARSTPSRLGTIQRAAFVPLSGLASTPFPDSLVSTAGVAAVTFPASPGADQLLTGPLPQSSELTVRVTYLFTCHIPVVSTFLCDSFAELAVKRLLAATGFIKHDHATEQGLRELQHAPLASAQALLWASGARMRVLRAEATMPAQRASYAYVHPAGSEQTKGEPTANQAQNDPTGTGGP